MHEICIHFYEFEGDLSTTHFYICHAVKWKKDYEYGVLYAFKKCEKAGERTGRQASERKKNKKSDIRQQQNTTFKFRHEKRSKQQKAAPHSIRQQRNS